MDTDGEGGKPSPKLRPGRLASNPLLPEVDGYLHLLVLLHLIDTDRPEEARNCAGMPVYIREYFSKL